MYAMFSSTTAFNGDLSGWDVSLVDDMGSMFSGATSFNGDLSSWNVSLVDDMGSMFSGATSFNGDLSSWNVSSVQDMSSMFEGATSFNGDISTWGVSSVVDMSSMFRGATVFNEDISGWNVSSVGIEFGGMSGMFSDATSFNADISGWNVSNVQDMSNMFSGATSFDRDLGSWDISSVSDMAEMFSGVTLSTTNYDNTLIGWDTDSSGTPDDGIDDIPFFIPNFSGGNSTYCNGEAARLSLMNVHLWVNLSDGLKDCSGLGLEDNELDSSILLYPNPVVDVIIIKSENLLESILVYDVTGRVIFKTIMEENRREKNISLKGINSGLYFINVRSNKGHSIKKIVKK
jgi:surface protein